MCLSKEDALCFLVLGKKCVSDFQLRWQIRSLIGHHEPQLIIQLAVVLTVLCSYCAVCLTALCAAACHWGA